jgi:pimeloyl-ACP methyl ester carboxylesterase
LAIGAHPVGNTLAHQLRPIADDLTARLVEDCGHIVPLDRPDVLVPLLTSFLDHDLDFDLAGASRLAP